MEILFFSNIVPLGQVSKVIKSDELVVMGEVVMVCDTALFPGGEDKWVLVEQKVRVVAYWSVLTWFRCGFGDFILVNPEVSILPNLNISILGCTVILGDRYVTSVIST